MSELGSDLQRLLQRVQKPGRYTGGEWNQIKKNPEEAEMKVALAFPDVYEVGMSHLGQKILYHVLNEISGVSAERVYTPWIDFEEQLRQKNMPLYSLENKIPLNRFEIIGISLLYELNYINILTILELGRIPFLSRDRKETDPLVIAGGPAAFNPEPVADIFDVFVIGDGEEVFPEIISQLKPVRNLSHKERLRRLQSISGIYIPSLYSVFKPEDSARLAVRPQAGAPEKIKKRLLKSLEKNRFPSSIIVPNIDTIFNRVSVEAGRGCPQNCRFCQARHIYFPTRWKNTDHITHTIRKSIRETGYEDASLASLSIGDYPGLNDVIEQLMPELSCEHVSLSLSSLRPGMLTREMAENILRVRKTGLTLVPEAGTDRLRKVINKKITDADIFQAAGYAFSAGWRKIKLYFMVGLPTENQADIQGIADMVKDIIRIGYRELKKSPQINLSVASFIPKPHTPFQWDAMEPEDKLREKHSFLKEQLKKYTFVQFKEHSLKSSLLEAVFSRGDRRLASVLIQAWKYGARFDSWTDCFDFSIWQKAFERQGIAVSDYLRSIEHSAVLPWEHIDCGIKKSHLLDEWKLSRKEEKSSKCRDRVCSQCRGCDFPGFEPKPAQFPCPVPVTIWHPLGNKDDDTVHRYRVRYQKTGPARFLSHIDTSTILQRGLRRSGIKALYSRGFHPKMQLSFPPALPLGMEGQNEVFEFRSHYVFPDETVSLVNTSLPGGIWLTAVDRIKFDSPSLTKSIQELVYSVRLDSETIRRGLEKHTMDMDEVISLILAHDRDSGPGAVKEISLNSKKHRLILVYSFQPGLSIRPQSILEELFSIPHPSFYLAREDIRLS